ncbi:MAG: two-component system, cell cycle sensor histidine kinase and response regulator CckA, partial [Gaiellaceae bacterium]|nr:two-component system, cell cycle sensor histidine kinase and response regulator CckA [Gaiellaceae bacterium]
MNTTPTSRADRLRWSWSLPEPGTRPARAMQATLAFYFLVVGSTLAVGVTLLGGRPHAGAVLLLSLSGYPLAAWCLLRYERMGNGSWQVVAALAAGAVSAGTVLDPRGWALALLLYFFFVAFTAFFFAVRALSLQLVIVLAGIAGAAAQQDSARDVMDWLLVGATLVALGATVVLGKRALWSALERLQIDAARQQQIAELGERALAEPDLSRVMDEAVRVVVRALVIDDAVVLERMPSRQAMIVRAAFVRRPENDSPVFPVGPGSFSAYTMLVDEPVVSEDIENETRFTPAAQLLGAGIQSAANVVIPGPSGPFGVLGVFSTTRRAFSETDLAFLQAIANVVGAAVRNRATEQTLERSRSGASLLSDRLEALIDASPLAIVELDLHGCVKLWNHAAERTFGWLRAEVIGTPYPVVPPDGKSDFAGMVATLKANGGHAHLEADRVHKDGSLLRCEIYGAAIRNDLGEITSLIAIIADVSERVRTAQELARSQELYKTVVENSRDMIAVLDPAGSFLFASPSYRSVLDHDPGRLVGTPFVDLLHPEDGEGAGVALHLATTSGSTASAELRMARAGADWANVEGTVTGVFDEHGRLQSLLTSFRDVTERREAQEELTNAELRYQTLVEQLPLITYVHSPDDHGPWSYFSPQLQAILGYEEADWRGNTGFYAQILDPQDRARVLATRAATTGRLSLEYRVVARDGRVVWVRDEALVVRDLGGRALYVQGYLLDTTAEREADRSRKGLEDQLLQSQKMEAVGRLAGGIAHDFNNLLTAITGYSELILTAMEPESESARDVEQIRRAAAQAASMTQQLLAFSRRQVLQPKVLNLNEILAEMEPMLKRLIGENIALVTAPEEELLSTRSDLAQIEQVILNLSVNARDAMPSGGRLELRTANVELREDDPRPPGTEPGPHVLLEVRDTGHGMGPETLEHAFEPFFTTKDQGKGTGLGLATVLGIVQQSGGGIVVESAPGEGTTFGIYLPAVLDAPTPEDPPAARPERGHETI